MHTSRKINLNLLACHNKRKKNKIQKITNKKTTMSLTQRGREGKKTTTHKETARRGKQENP